MRILALSWIALLILVSAKAPAENPSNFTLQSALDEDTFELSKHQGKSVVLHFLLKTECPFCLKYTHEYAVLAAKTPDLVHLFLKPDSVEEIKSWADNLDKNGLKDLPKIYRDPGAKLAKQFGIPDGYKFHGQTVHFPALVAISSDGKELFRYVGKSNGDRMSTAEFSKKMESAKRQ